ncbi:hypothetical protein GGR54DRAFT_6517 [Hypoxylon sp. NC1633]|nr:hypothetical protein GGR54DRAFT_6517 [Hypoxylon sp. NC1633]
MAPELRKRKSKDAGISAAKPASKVKADASATKRKATDDASPVAVKKSRPVNEGGRLKKTKASSDQTSDKKTSKSARSAAPKKKDEDEDITEDADAQISGEEQDDTQALAKIVDSDDEDPVVDPDVDYQEGQDLGLIPTSAKKMLKSSKSEDGEPGVIYVGHLPHGFYEHEMRSYFSQFGKVERLRMSRNKKTGASKHFAFIEFASAPVAEIVAKTMNHYLLFGRVLSVKVIPKSQIHEDLWKGSNRRFKKVPWNKMAGNQLKKPLSESTWTQKITKEEQRRSERAQKLLDMGYSFEAPKLKSVDEVERVPAALEGADIEAPEPIEPAPEAGDAEAQAPEDETKNDADESLNTESAAKKAASSKTQDTAKSTKKTKKSSKAKKAVA